MKLNRMEVEFLLAFTAVVIVGLVLVARAAHVKVDPQAVTQCAAMRPYVGRTHEDTVYWTAWKPGTSRLTCGQLLQERK